MAANAARCFSSTVRFVVAVPADTGGLLVVEEGALMAGAGSDPSSNAPLFHLRAARASKPAHTQECMHEICFIFGPLEHW